MQASPNQLLFPNEIRDGNNFIGLSTTFRWATGRRSEIIAGTSAEKSAVEAGETICDVTFHDRLEFDHLVVTLLMRPIDGENGILAYGGPCAFNGLPVFGKVELDMADMGLLASRGSLKSVFLHEMGHVLWIGSSWRRFDLLKDPVLNADGSMNNPAHKPGMIGKKATEQFKLLTGNHKADSVPVEDGTTNGKDIFDPKTEGVGSIDAHWDRLLRWRTDVL